MDHLGNGFELMSGVLNMMLASGDRIRLDAATYTRTNPSAATASFKLDNDGQAYAADNSSGGSSTARYSWVTPNANAALYDVRWSTSAGAVDSSPGAEATNLNLGTDRTWSETNNLTTESCTFTVSIYRAGESTNPLATASITLSVDGTP